MRQRLEFRLHDGAGIRSERQSGTGGIPALDEHPQVAIDLVLVEEADSIEGFTFVWFADGIGWKSARGNLRETFDVMKHMYNIDDMEKGIMSKIFV